RVVPVRLEDRVQVVLDGREEARRQLRAGGARVEQRRRRGHEVEAGQQVVELDGAGLAVLLAQRQTHGHPHEERLRQLVAGAVVVQEVAVVERLQTEETELEVAFRLDRRGDRGQVEFAQLRVDLTEFDRPGQVGAEVAGVVQLGLGGRARLVCRYDSASARRLFSSRRAVTWE